MQKGNIYCFIAKMLQNAKILAFIYITFIFQWLEK